MNSKKQAPVEVVQSTPIENSNFVAEIHKVRSFYYIVIVNPRNGKTDRVFNTGRKQDAAIEWASRNVELISYWAGSAVTSVKLADAVEIEVVS